MTNHSLQRSVFLIRKMDCASEENIVRMKLSELQGIRALEFDVPGRRLTVVHAGNLEEIRQSIDALNFNASLLTTDVVNAGDLTSVDANVQSTLLWKVLLINFSFFIIEIVTGFFSRSMGLVADSLDMLADALVYGMSLLAVGGTISRKKRIAAVSGYFQIALAVVGFVEVLRRFMGYESAPDFRMMIIVSCFALIANAVCLYLLQKSKSQEAHMKASMIFTSNDVIINLGVIVAGILVFVLHSGYPDLIIGAIVFVLVIRGAISILKLSK